MAESGLIAITAEDEMPKPVAVTVAASATATDIPTDISTSTDTRATPTIPTGGLFSPYATAHINASPLAVYEAIIDVASWKQWNSFVPSVTMKPTSGSSDTSKLFKNASMTFKVNMTYGTSTVSKELVNVLDPPPSQESRAGSITRICWILDNKAIVTPRFLMHAERVNEIEDRGDGTCVYRTWETFGGPVARIVRWKYEAILKERFKDWVKDLKTYVETKEAIKQQRVTAFEMPA